MSTSQPARSTVRFGLFVVDLAAGQLRRNGAKIKIQEMPFRLFVCLLERPGEVVTREELRYKLWAKDEFVEFEHSLNTAVNKLRRALNDSSRQPQYIETIPRRGHRFIGTVEGLVRKAKSPAGRSLSEGKTAAARRLRRWVAAAAAVFLVLAATWWFLRREGSGPLPLAVAGGKAQQVNDNGGRLAWVGCDGESLYYFEPIRGDSGYLLKFCDLTTEKSGALTYVEVQPVHRTTVSPDRKVVLFGSRAPRNINLTLVKYCR